MKKHLITLLAFIILSACSQGNWGWEKNGSNADIQPSPRQPQQDQTIVNPQFKTPEAKVVTAPSANFTGHHQGVYFVNGKPRNNAPGSGVPLFEHPAQEHQRKIQENRRCLFAWQCR